RKHMRQSTTEHTRQTFLRIQERQGQSKRKKGGPNYDRPLTQEELLEEAKITEEINLRSLGELPALPRGIGTPRRVLGELAAVPRGEGTPRRVLGELGAVPGAPSPRPPRLEQDPQQAEAGSGSAGKCSRTFICFSDDETFERCFPRCRPPRAAVRELCPVTHRPARYRDPITDIPYGSARAFRIIRDAYKKYITAHGLPSAAPTGAAPTGTDPGPRAPRQKIIIKQSVPTA
ncbi:VPS72 protein, partial [Ramphastos sulfuratus]|nr:VPS72 protein [Ramphastos sulfuratus]